MKASTLIKVLTVLGLATGTAFAQDVKDMVPKSDETVERSLKADGWSYNAKASATGSLSRHNRWIGQTEGTSYLLGANLEGGFNYKAGQNEFLNTITLNQGTSKVPNIDHYIKTADTLKWESIYLYTLASMPQIAPFVKGSAETSIFQNTIYTAVPTTFVASDGTSVLGGKKFRTNDAFDPLTIKLTAGAFYTPIKRSDMKLSFSLGIGHLNVKAEGYSVASSDLATNVVTLNKLDDFNQTGAVFGANWKGHLDKRTGYDVGYEMFFPLAFDDEVGPIADPSASDLVNHDFYAKLNTKLTEYFSLNYEYRWKKVPQLLDNSQQAHLVGVGVSYVLF